MARSAKNDGMTGSDAIREQLEINPKASPSEIKQALTAKGIKVSDSLISAVKYRKRKGKKGRKKPGRKPGRPAAAKAKAAGDTISVDALVAASKLVQTLGGADNAIKAIGVLKRVGG